MGPFKDGFGSYSSGLPFPSLSFPFFPFPSLSFPFLPFPSLSFPFLPFPSLSFPFLPFPSHSFPFLPFPSLSFPFSLLASSRLPIFPSALFFFPSSFLPAFNKDDPNTCKSKTNSNLLSRMLALLELASRQIRPHIPP